LFCLPGTKINQRLITSGLTASYLESQQKPLKMIPRNISAEVPLYSAGVDLALTSHNTDSTEQASPH